MSKHDESRFALPDHLRKLRASLPLPKPYEKPERICDDCEYRGCDTCPIEADEELCDEACSSDRPDYDDSTPGRNWEYYKSECLEALEDKMKEEPMSACDALECKYRGGEMGCRLLADPHECGVISSEYNRDEWEAHVAHRRDVLLKIADELRDEA